MEGDGLRRELEDEVAALTARLDMLEARLAAIEEPRHAVPAPVRPAASPAVASPAARRLHAEPVREAQRMPPAPPASPGWRTAPQASPTTWPAAAPVAPRGTDLGPGRVPSESPEPGPTWTSEPAGPSWTASISLRDLEERFAGRALAWTGGLALVAAAIFFLSLAFTRGWITEPLRVVIGLAVGVATFGLGGVMLIRRNALMGHVLTAVGLGVTSITLMAATRLYALVPPEVGLLLALVAAVAAAVLAVRTNSVVVAAYGLIAALIAPPLTGAPPNLLTLGFVAVTLVGTTGVALFRSWRWLPQLAFLLAAPQLASWLTGDPVPAQALVALAGFWIVNIVAAAGEEVRIRRDDLRPSSATLVLANATFLLWGGFVVLAGDMAQWRGTFVAIAAVAHLLVGAWFLQRQGLRHLFGNLVAGTGVACLTIAAFVQLGAPAVPLAWAAEAVALAWLAVRRLHRWSAVAALVLAGLTLGHLVLLEYPLWGFGIPSRDLFPLPFQHAEAGSLAAVLFAIAVAVVLVPVRWVRSALAGLGILLAAYAVTFELTGPGLVAALAVLAVAGVLVDRLVTRVGVAADLAPVAAWTTFGWTASVGSLVAGLMAVYQLTFLEYPLVDFDLPTRHPFPAPFQHPEAASLAILLAGLALVAWLVPVRWVRSALAGLGVALAAYAMTFEVAGPALAAALMALVIGGLLLDRLVARMRVDAGMARLAGWVSFDWLASFGSLIAGLLAINELVFAEYPAARFGTLFPAPFQHPEAASLVIFLAGLALAGWLLPARWIRSALAGLGLLLVAYALPFELTRTSLVAGLVVLLPAGILVDRGLGFLREDPRFAELAAVTRYELSAATAGGVAWGFAVLYSLTYFIHPFRWGIETPPPVPFSDERALVGALLAGSALAAVRWLVPISARRVAVLAALVVAADVIPFEVYADGVAVLWVVLAGLALLASRWDTGGLRVFGGLAALLVAGAGVVAFGIVASPDRLWVVYGEAERSPLLAAWPLAFAALALALYGAARLARLARWRTWLELAAGATGVYIASVAVVDVFQRALGGPIPAEELAKQGQVALSVVWTMIGAVALVIGVVRLRPMLRHAGLGLLGLATGKVFLIDLAAMDVAYRAVVLAALGLLLLASAYLFTRFRGPRAGPTGITGGATGHA